MEETSLPNLVKDLHPSLKMKNNLELFKNKKTKTRKNHQKPSTYLSKSWASIFIHEIQKKKSNASPFSNLFPPVDLKLTAAPHGQTSDPGRFSPTAGHPGFTYQATVVENAGFNITTSIF